MIAAKGTRNLIFRLILSSTMLLLGAKANAYYVSSSITLTNSVYGFSTTYLEPDEYPPNNMASVIGVLIAPNGSRSEGWGHSYNDNVAGAITYGGKMTGVYNLSANHYADGYSYWTNLIATTNATLEVVAPAIDYFYASSPRIYAPGTITLYYGTHNGSSAAINGTPVSLNSGTFSVTLNTTRTYTLSLTNQYGTVQASITVWAEYPGFYQYSVRHEKGAPPFFPQTTFGGETVNAANGNLFFTIPLLNRPGRNGLGVDLKLAYNSKIWDYFFDGELIATLAERDSWVGVGWTLLVARMIEDTANGHCYLTLSDGSIHDLTYYDGAWRSMDSSYMLYDPATHKLTLKGGTVITLGYSDPLRPWAFYATRIMDTNGNYLDISYQGSGGKIAGIQDTLGNTYTFTLQNNHLRSIQYFNTNDTTQATSSILFTYETQTLEFGSAAATDPTLNAQYELVEVGIWPKLTHFQYSSSGELTKIIYPACAESNYSYTDINVFDRVINRSVPEHWISSHDTGHWDPWTWTLNDPYHSFGQADWETKSSPPWVLINAPDNVVYEISLRNGNTWADGFVYTVETRKNGYQFRLIKTFTEWTQDDIGLSTLKNPRKSSTITRKNGYYHWQYKDLRTEYGYAGGSDHSGNVKEIREYNYDGGLMRKTQFNYWHESHSGYAALNMLDRVSEVLVFDGASNLVGKSQTVFDNHTSIYAADNAIRHDTAFGVNYVTRGLPTSGMKWYNISQNQYITVSMRYDACGNLIDVTDPRGNTTHTDYWLSSGDNAHALPLRVINALGHLSGATYSHRSGQKLSQTDANGQITSFHYDNQDRVIQVDKPTGGKEYIRYEDCAYCQMACWMCEIPYVEITKELSSTTSRKSRVDRFELAHDSMMTGFDSNGNINQLTAYNHFEAPQSASLPYRGSNPQVYVNYTYYEPGLLAGITSPSMHISFSYSQNSIWVNDDLTGRRYDMHENGKPAKVVDPDSSSQYTVETNYGYDALGRLTQIVQGIQTRSFTYDNLGRLLSETHPEKGTTSYTYDANSNVLTKTNARGITTSYTYDALNRVTLRAYSDGTPSVSYIYDSAPGDSPISIQNVIGRLAKKTTTAGGITVSNFYSYCNCSSLEREATVIFDGITRTYTTSYTYNYAGDITSITYPNGKIVTYGRDDNGRENRVSSTIGAEAIDYVASAAYLGPNGNLTEIQYGLRYNPYQRVMTTMAYSAGLQLTNLQTLGLNLSFNYMIDGNVGNTQRIYDISNYRHFAYDNWGRLASYWESTGREGTQDLRIDWVYDRYGNTLTKTRYAAGCPPEGCIDTLTVDSATNRITAWTPNQGGLGPEFYTYDTAGNRTDGGKTYDAENRLLGWTGTSFLYDASSRRFRKNVNGAVTYYVYSAMGFLLVEDDLSTGTTSNQIYFNGQLVATHDQSDNVRFYFKDHLESVRSIVTATPGSPWGYSWQTTAVFDYYPYGDYRSYSITDPLSSKIRFTGKERDSNGLDYFGARYYDSNRTQRWISADPVTARIYDPPSLNKYVYVRNDPVNRVDPDGRDPIASKTLSDAGAQFIANYETFQSKIYKDQAGNDTIGYGHLITAADGDKYVNGISSEDALALFKSDLSIYIESVNRDLTVDVTQQQFDALVSFAFNTGQYALGGSQLLKAINNGTAVTEDLFTMWNKVLNNGTLVVSQGLTSRRKDEFELFSIGDYIRGPRPIMLGGEGGALFFGHGFDLIDMFDLFNPVESELDRFINWVYSIEVNPREEISVRIIY